MGKFRKSETVTIGGFDLIKMNTLRQFEEEWLEKYFANEADLVSLPALQFAQHLVESKGITEEQATEEISNLDSLDSAGMLAFLLRYRKVIPDIIDGLINAPKLKAKGPIEVGCFVLQSRLRDGWLQENRNELREDLDIDIATNDEWQMTWMDELGIDTIQELYEFFMKERMGWQSVAIELMGVESEALEAPTLGEELPPSNPGSPPTGVSAGQPLKPLELVTKSSIGKTGKTARSA